MYRLRQFVLLASLAAFGNPAAVADIVVRAENFTVPPATGPVTHVVALNTGDAECTATIEPRFPDGWQWSPESRELTLAPGESKRLPFTIEKASDEASNRYPVEINVVRGPDKTVHRQEVFCASAPYLTPRIDGKLTEWSDAIPVTFTTAGRKTTVCTYWNKRYFYLYVQVEEDRLHSHKKNATVVDAVQFCLAPSEAVTPSNAQARALRSEFLLVDVGGPFGKDKCFQLIRPDQDLSVARQDRNLDDLVLGDAELSVKRQGKITHYECAIPFAAIPTIRPAVGREIRFSLLVHDPDGTGVRDWGKAAGLLTDHRKEFAWCKWNGAKWPAEPLCDSKVEFGLCSSKH